MFVHVFWTASGGVILVYRETNECTLLNIFSLSEPSLLFVERKWTQTLTVAFHSSVFEPMFRVLFSASKLGPVFAFFFFLSLFFFFHAEAFSLAGG